MSCNIRDRPLDISRIIHGFPSNKLCIKHVYVTYTFTYMHFIHELPKGNPRMIRDMSKGQSCILRDIEKA